MSEPKKTLKKTASNSSINTAAGSEDESGKVASRSAYFNVFPDPNVPGNHVTMNGRTGFMIKIGDTTDKGGKKGGRDGYGTYLPNVYTISTSQCSPSKFERIHHFTGKKMAACYWGKWIEWMYLEKPEEKRNKAYESDGSSEWYLISIKPTQRLEDLAQDLSVIQAGFAKPPFQAWGKSLSKYTKWEQEQWQQTTTTTSAFVTPIQPLKPEPKVLQFDKDIMQCQTWAVELEEFIARYDIWSATREHPNIVQNTTTTTAKTITTSSSTLPSKNSSILTGDDGNILDLNQEPKDNNVFALPTKPLAKKPSMTLKQPSITDAFTPKSGSTSPFTFTPSLPLPILTKGTPSSTPTVNPLVLSSAQPSMFPSLSYSPKQPLATSLFSTSTSPSKIPSKQATIDLDLTGDDDDPPRKPTPKIR